MQTAKDLGIKPSRPDLHPSVIIIPTSSITCHHGSQYWSSVLLPRTSLGLLIPLKPFCISAPDPGSFPILVDGTVFISLFRHLVSSQNWGPWLPGPWTVYLLTDFVENMQHSYIKTFSTTLRVMDQYIADADISAAIWIVFSASADKPF